MFELLLLTVGLSASYWGVMLLRRRQAPTFAMMLLATGAAAWISYAARGEGGPGELDVVGAVAIGAGACLLVIGPMLRQAARWAVATDRFRLAGVLIELRDLMQPGTSSGDDQATLAALRDVRAGEVDGAVAALREARAKAPAAVHRAFDERIALLYVVAMRWEDAIAHAEATLLPAVAARAAERAEDRAGARDDDRADDRDDARDDGRADDHADVHDDARADAGAPASAGADRAEAAAAPAGPRLPIDLGRALGLSPPVWVELTAAYGRVGRLDRAAEMADAFDRAAAGAAGTEWLLHRVRLVFLAAVGRVDAVRRLLAQPQAREIRPASRLYWTGLAAERAGDRDGARAAYRAALARARRAPRVVAAIERALAELDAAAPAAPSPAVAAVADRLAAAEVTLPAPPPRRTVRVTAGVIAANVAVACATALLVGAPGDLGAVVRVGADVRSATDAGEWWRVPASVFVHIGWIHLFVNMLGLWSLGRLAEGIFGSARTFAIYGAAGVGGMIASHVFRSAGVTAGASGALFGVLGALVVELALARRRYPPAGRRALIGALVFVAIVQIGLGQLFVWIDQSAHVAGLVTGAAIGALVSPHGPAARARLWIARVLAGALAVLFVVAAALAAATPYAATFARYPRTARVWKSVEITVPTDWTSDGTYLDDPDQLWAFVVERTPAGPAAGRFDDWRATERGRAVALGFQEAVAAPDTLVTLPAGWQSAELIASIEDQLGATQRYRVVLFAHDLGGETLLGALYVPDLLARTTRDELVAMITSARPAP